MSEIAITKLDVLDGLPELKICTGYEIKGQLHEYIPSSMYAFKAIQPIYDTFPGWSESTGGISSFEKLPENAKKYLKRIETLTGFRISFISTSPEREDLVQLHNPFTKPVE